MMRCLNAIIACIALYISHVVAQRDHVLIRRLPDQESLEAEGIVVDDVTLWDSEGNLTVLFKDGRSVLIHSKNNLHDVFINDHFSHTCAFRTPWSHGTLMMIIKEKQNIKIAESPDSFCLPIFEIKQEAVPKKKKQAKSLRVAVLKAQAATHPKYKSVRFAI